MEAVICSTIAAEHMRSMWQHGKRILYLSGDCGDLFQRMDNKYASLGTRPNHKCSAEVVGTVKFVFAKKLAG